MDTAGPDSESPSYRYRFGETEFDEARFELRIGGLAVDLEQRPLQVLAQLLHHAGEVVTREELFESVWAGRPTVDNVLANAVAKLRKVLGPEDGARILTLPRIGYRLTGPVERIAAGRRLSSRMDFSPGRAVPGREHFILEKQLGPSHGNEIWLARHDKTGERRVYKFSGDGEHLASLKREATIYRVLHESLGERDDFVRIIDWNFETAPFYLECEYGGADLNDWATSGGLTALPLERRLALFLQIADAVAAAHGVGVLHKDLKPGNVLITPRGDGWQVRIADFGSSRLLEPGRLEELGITAMGLTVTQTVSADTGGTLAYLAPELLAGKPPNVQSDLYALGLMLYQLVVGDLHRPLAPGWEQDTPDDLLVVDIAAATDGNPARRLASVAELIERLRHRNQRRQERRALQDAELRAREAERLLERSRARRPWIVAAGVVLAAGLGGASGLYLKAASALRRAELERQRAAAVTQFLDDDVLGAADPYLADTENDMTVRQALDHALQHVQEQFSQFPGTEAAIRTTLATVLHRLQDLPAAEAQWRRAIPLLMATEGAHSAATVQARYQLSLTLSVASHFKEAGEQLRLADAGSSGVLDDDASTGAIAGRAWGVYYLNQQQFEPSIRHLERALALEEKVTRPNRYLLNGIRMDLMAAYTGSERFADTIKLGTSFLAELKTTSSANDLTLAHVEHYYGEALLYQDHPAEAAPLIEDAVKIARQRLGIGNPIFVEILDTQCELYFRTDQRARALDCAQEMYEAMLHGQGPDHWMTWGALANIGSIQYSLGRYDASADTLRKARAGLSRTLGDDNAVTQASRYYLARSLLKLGQADEAGKLASALKPEVLNSAEPGAPWKLRLDLLRGLVLQSQGHHRQAMQLLQPAVDTAAKHHIEGDAQILEQAQAELAGP